MSRTGFDGDLDLLRERSKIPRNPARVSWNDDRHTVTRLRRGRGLMFRGARVGLRAGRRRRRRARRVGRRALALDQHQRGELDRGRRVVRSQGWIGQVAPQGAVFVAGTPARSAADAICTGPMRRRSSRGQDQSPPAAAWDRECGRGRTPPPRSPPGPPTGSRIELRPPRRSKESSRGRLAPRPATENR